MGLIPRCQEKLISEFSNRIVLRTCKSTCFENVFSSVEIIAVNKASSRILSVRDTKPSSNGAFLYPKYREKQTIILSISLLCHFQKQLNFIVVLCKFAAQSYKTVDYVAAHEPAANLALWHWISWTICRHTHTCILASTFSLSFSLLSPQSLYCSINF